MQLSVFSRPPLPDIFDQCASFAVAMSRLMLTIIKDFNLDSVANDGRCWIIQTGILLDCLMCILLCICTLTSE